MKILSRKITEATVNNLNPGREYEFMVLSQDKHGDGMFSKTLRIFTQPSMYDFMQCGAKSSELRQSNKFLPFSSPQLWHRINLNEFLF